MDALLIDGNYLCHRAEHSTGGLSCGGVSTGVIFGVLDELARLVQRYPATGLVCWCWDCGPLLRKNIDPGYKSNRGLKPGATPEEIAARESFLAAMKMLAEDVLPGLGFVNNYSFQGYEADDVLASLTMTAPQGVRCVVVSADGDLYQLLRPGVIIYNPGKKKEITHQDFLAEYGITPDKWPQVKALAGCVSDMVIGLKGVGEKTACAHIAGTLPQHHKIAGIINAEGAAVISRNFPLVLLPLYGMPLPVVPQRDGLSPAKWSAMCDRFRIKTLTPPALPGLSNGVPRGFKKQAGFFR